MTNKPFAVTEGDFEVTRAAHVGELVLFSVLHIPTNYMMTRMIHPVQLKYAVDPDEMIKQHVDSMKRTILEEIQA